MLVNFENVTFAYTDVPILTDVSFSLHEKERVGLIGGNGEGKTTLIRLILGELAPDRGNIFLKNGIRIGYLAQSGGLETQATVWEAMQEVFAQDRELIAQLRETELKMQNADEEAMRALSARYESLNRRIAARDSYHCDVRVRTVLNGMGFADVYDQVVSTMSGGEKTRLKLCRLLLEEPELLILDEPTNHLDVKTLFWLEDYLASYKGSVFAVSHDRYFLDRLTSRTLELERGTVRSFKGNYSKYKILKEELFALQEKEYEKQQEEIAKLQDYVDRNLVRATTAKSAQSRVKQLDKMTLLEKPVPPPPPPRFSFTYRDRPYERVIDAPDFSLAVDGKTLIGQGSFTLMRGKKCALTGDNGTGKSTLLRFLMSKDPRVRAGKFVKFAYYDQENADLDPAERVLDCFWGKHSLLTQTQARNLLAQSGLQAEDMDKTVAQLSGGERAKLELALLQAAHGNVLVLDEPTNHLDLPARESLEAALRAFDGTVLFVSHDRYFIGAVADCIALIENGKLTFFDGTYDEFLEAQRKKQDRPPLPPPAPAAEKSATEKERGGYRSKEERAKEAKAKQRTKQIETRLEELEARESELNAEMAEYAADYAKMQEIWKELESLHAETDALYAEYETLI